MAVFERRKYEPRKEAKPRARGIPGGLWTKCPGCGEVVYQQVLKKSLQVCPKCGHHFSLGARDRLVSVCDGGKFIEQDEKMEAVDVLQFKGVASYTSKLRSNRKKTGLKDAIVCGTGIIGGREVSLAALEFAFLGGSMGAVVGEKVTRTIERGLEKKIPVIIFSASGGARMYEGMFSLMQMAKTSGALARLGAAGLPFFSVLTNPTMAGVMASFASLGDFIIAEPRAMIGFAGARVIRETTQQVLPKGFQTSEFLHERGLIDM
ncbi:MAG: acetyl-CoA carboxylase, carboxyltransferase subunit beta, partial [Verrucomicrobia bacterium]|nr:acetyl-CoA carboxylase, carboxyltransferase subunit beta [Verrucomicrobiota bacterium]